MSQHDRAGNAALAEINVGMADPTGHDADQEFVLTRAFHFQGVDLQRDPRLAQHGRSDRNEGRDRLFHAFTAITV
jgi:hypothetical protein